MIHAKVSQRREKKARWGTPTSRVVYKRETNPEMLKPNRPENIEYFVNMVYNAKSNKKGENQESLA
jgi:hypothetical protein